jgi:putative mycofactocin binding protein MftB
MAAAGAGLQLHPACRVRQEEFGLLFYDSRGPRLLFVETGAVIKPEFFTGTEPISSRLEQLERGEQSRVRGLLAKLQEKGYLREQSIC